MPASEQLLLLKPAPDQANDQVGEVCGVLRRDVLAVAASKQPYFSAEMRCMDGGSLW